jgi:DNA-binding GntR family transcriptional regulator
MPAKRALSRFSLPERVAESLREMIVTGEFATGEKVPVATLAEQLAVSPTPLREALKVLAAEGLVELLPNRGARVASYTVEDARHLFEVIASLESRAAELAAERMARGELKALEVFHREMRGFFEAGDRDSYFRHNSLIHGAIIAGARNPVLSATHSKLIIRASRGRFIAIADPHRWAEAMDEHEQVMAALRAQDAPAAAAVWRMHLEHTGAATVRALEAAAPKQKKVSNG